MKVGDRVMYKNEPWWVSGFLTTRDRGWVLIRHADGTHRYVRPVELYVLDQEVERKWR